MTKRVYNFGAGPTMLPTPVMEQVRDEFLNYRGLGASVIEISHRSREFEEIIAGADQLIRELSGLPDNYRILYVAGGARMQFSAMPMNLINRLPSRKALYFESGDFAKWARLEAERYGDVRVVASSEGNQFDRIPEVDPQRIEQDACYAHLTSNNTLYGTRWHDFPDTGAVPLVIDATSEIFSRVWDYSRFGAVYAGFQKNLGPAGLALVLIREDLLGHAMPETPSLLNYAEHAKSHSLANTINTFAVYVLRLVLEWMKAQGGIKALEARNDAKARILYEVLDSSDFYRGIADPEHRSAMNVTFRLPDAKLLAQFLEQASAVGLYALKGHSKVGGARASIYNPMPLEGVQALAQFMREFERRYG